MSITVVKIAIHVAQRWVAAGGISCQSAIIYQFLSSLSRQARVEEYNSFQLCSAASRRRFRARTFELAAACLRLLIIEVSPC